MPNKFQNTQVAPDPQPADSDIIELKTDGRQAPGELMELSKDDRAEIKRVLKQAIDDWTDNSGPHQRDLRRWNDLVEGVVPETDFPWEGASNLHVPMIAIHLITLHSIMYRSLLTPEPMWFARTLDPAIRPAVPQIEEALDFLARTEWNIVDAVSEVIWTTGRDGNGWLQVPYVEEYEQIEDSISFESADEFATEFPDAESAGMTQDEYDAKKKEVAGASPEAPVTIDISVERLVYGGPKAEVIEEAEMVRFPVTAKTETDCIACGPRMRVSTDWLRKQVAAGNFYKDAVKSLLQQTKTAQQNEQTEWEQSRNEIDGISFGNSQDISQPEIFSLVLKYDLDGDGIDEKYIATYSKEPELLLGFKKYFYRTDILVGFRLMKRPNRLLSPSVPGMLEPLNTEIDASINHEINSGTIELSPAFKAQKSANMDFDPHADENRWRPGVVFWLENPDSFKQFDVRPTDKKITFTRRQELMRYAEMQIGPTQLLSGRESPTDPDAPGNKTIALIQQSNMRIEDYINEFRKGFNKLGMICLSHLYQFGPDTIQFESASANRAVQELRRRHLRGDIKLYAHGITATANPFVEMQKAMQIFAFLQGEQMVGADPAKRRELIMNVLVAGRVANREKLLPTPDQIEQEKIEIQKKAIRQIISEGLGLAPPANMVAAPSNGAGGPPPAPALGIPPPIPTGGLPPQ